MLVVFPLMLTALIVPRETLRQNQGQTTFAGWKNVPTRFTAPMLYGPIEQVAEAEFCTAEKVV
jgi:hypothetical protein